MATSNQQPASQIMLTYAAKTKRKITPLISFAHPDEIQGIIFNHVNDTPIPNYFEALSPLIGGPLNIIAASRVSGNRVIIFLSNANIVNDFMTNHGGFRINEGYVKIRYLKSTLTKLILSNVSPMIPTILLENYLSKTLNLDLVSPISIFRVNPNDEKYAHISFRRQLYYRPKANAPPLLDSFLLEHNDHSYRIFITYDELLRFKCKSKGHKADDCEASVEFNSLILEHNKEDLPPLSEQKISAPSSFTTQYTEKNFPELPTTNSTSTFTDTATHKDTNEINTNKQDRTKRALSDNASSSSSTQSVTLKNDDAPQIRKQTKKSRLEDNVEKKKG